MAKAPKQFRLEFSVKSAGTGCDMDVRRAVPEVRQALLSMSGLVKEIENPLLLWRFALCSQEPFENPTHCMGVSREGMIKRRDRLKTEASRNRQPSRGLSRKGMRLLFVHDLQTVLNSAQKDVCLAKRIDIFARQDLELLERGQRLHRAAFLKEGIPGPVQELQGLHNEFDLPNATESEFDIAMQVFGTHEVPLDPNFQVSDLFQKISRHGPRKNEGLEPVFELIEQLLIATDPAGFNEGHALPGFAVSGVVIFEAGERANERSNAPFRPKPEINTE